MWWEATHLADAWTVDGYQRFFFEAGFEGVQVEEHSRALFTLLGRVRAGLRLGRVASLAGLLPTGGVNLDAVERVVDQIDELVGN